MFASFVCCFLVLTFLLFGLSTTQDCNKTLELLFCVETNYALNRDPSNFAPAVASQHVLNADIRPFQRYSRHCSHVILRCGKDIA